MGALAGDILRVHEPRTLRPDIASRNRMDILIATAKDATEWRDGLAARLPQARVHVADDAPPCDYAVLWRPPDDVFARHPHLKALFSLGAGVDGLLAMPTLPPGIPLVRMEDGGMLAQMVEYALYVALREFRGFRAYGASQSRHEWAPRGMRPRAAFRVGVLGLGVLGGGVAQELAAFGFDVAGWSRTPRGVPGVHCQCGDAALDAVLARSDLLLLFLPATPSTTGLVDRERIARMPAGAAIANLSRGELVDEDAVLEALDSGALGAAYLDVFRHEPLPRGHALWTHPRVHITPHVAALTDVDAACDQVASKILRFEAGLAVSGIVERERGY
jgi:glyoxylate/hydroxypyruvate reductase A